MAQRSMQSQSRLLFKNTGEKNSNDGHRNWYVITLRHTVHSEERASVRNWGRHDRNLARLPIFFHSTIDTYRTSASLVPPRSFCRMESFEPQPHYGNPKLGSFLKYSLSTREASKILIFRVNFAATYLCTAPKLSELVLIAMHKASIYSEDFEPHWLRLTLNIRKLF